MKKRKKNQFIVSFVAIKLVSASNDFAIKAMQLLMNAELWKKGAVDKIIEMLV